MENAGNQSALIILKEYSSDAEAYIDKGLLEANGVKCILNNEIMSSIYPITFNSIGIIKLLVLKRDEETARRILAAGNDQFNQAD